jgi:hypothetical protein
MSTPRATGHSTNVSVEAVADCPFSMADTYAADFLRAAEANGPEATIRVPWHVPMMLMRRRVTVSFGMHMDLPEDGRSHDEIRVRWESGSKLLPNFHGAIRFRIDENRTRIIIVGSYTPPLGVAGQVFDALVGRWIARSSMTDLAGRIARYLSAREAAWSAQHATDAALREEVHA